MLTSLGLLEFLVIILRRTKWQSIQTFKYEHHDAPIEIFGPKVVAVLHVQHTRSAS